MKYILVVDDSAELLESFQMILTINGYACNGIMKEDEIFTAITERKPDLIFLDIHLGGMDGREVCKRIKQHPASSDIPVILTSGHEHKLKDYQQYQADGILEKPFSLKDLLGVIKTSLPA